MASTTEMSTALWLYANPKSDLLFLFITMTDILTLKGFTDVSLNYEYELCLTVFLLSLIRFLYQYKSSTLSPSMTLTTQAIVDMALQTVVALQFLHRKKILHKDVAARNCL